jgi:uncharacterized protein (DUF2249 family)
MHITAQTKIASLLKASPDALEAIVALSPHFKKLRNPFLRRLMAGRTSIGEAARIGGCSPVDFFRVLAPLGFEVDQQANVELGETNKQPMPDFLRELDPALLVTIDVRAMLAEGNDPLQYIQQNLKNLQPGQVLRIINTFEPTPLIRLLDRQGFKAHVECLDKQLIETWFYKVAEASAPVAANDSGYDWEDLLLQYKEHLEEVDVRHLEMPAPMMTILDALDKLQPGKALFVHHKRVPIYLLSELKERGFAYRIHDESEGQVKLLIYREGV